MAGVLSKTSRRFLFVALVEIVQMFPALVCRSWYWLVLVCWCKVVVFQQPVAKYLYLKQKAESTLKEAGHIAKQSSARNIYISIH